MFTPARVLAIDENQRKRLRFLATSRKTPQRVALREPIVLPCLGSRLGLAGSPTATNGRGPFRFALGSVPVLLRMPCFSCVGQRPAGEISTILNGWLD